MKRPIRMALLALAVGGVVVVLVNITADEPAPLGVGELAVPAIGTTEPGLLHDGHPVFVTHDLDGTISVLNAISTHISADRMGWCPTSRTIDDMFHGPRWDAQGRYISGPGPSNLGLYDHELAADGERLVVVKYLGASSRTQSPTGYAGPKCVYGGYETHPYHDAD